MLDVFLMLAVFAGAFLIGYALIARIPPMLHTPLMSMTNAISAVTILGALILFNAEAGGIEIGLACVALAAAAFNLAGGFAITDRMLSLFRRKDPPTRAD